MAEKKIEKCAHPGCNCPAAPGSKYCGAYCEGSANRPSIRATAGMRSVAPAKWQALQDKRCRRDKNRDPGSDSEWLAGGGKLDGSSVQGGRNHV